MCTRRNSIQNSVFCRGNSHVLKLQKQRVTIMATRVRLVSFQDDKEMVEIPCRIDYTPHELLCLHFSAFELAVIREREDRLNLEPSVFGRISFDDDHNSTELDSVQTNPVVRRKQMLLGIQTVLTEQELEHIEGGARDDDYIAKIYRNATRQNKALAHHRGVYMAAEVKAIHCNEQIPSRSSGTTISLDHNPRKRDYDMCEVGATNESSPGEPSSLSAQLSWMIVVPMDCE